MPALTPARIATDDLVPGPGLTPVADGWAVEAPHVRLAAPADLVPGWYEVRIGVESADRFTLRKRLELTFEAGDGQARPVAREQFAWNQGFAESFTLRLTRPVSGVRIDIWHAEGTIALDSFRVRRLTRASALARAVGTKVRLTRAYRCFGSAAVRGGKLLARGRLREFSSKLFKGLTDERALQLGLSEALEVDGGWWRRHALPTEQADAVRSAVDGMTDPPPFAVLIPFDHKHLDAARLSAHSVRRQLYPHWHLLLAVEGPPELGPAAERLIGLDPRVLACRVPVRDGLSMAVARVLGQTECERVVILPPGAELAEHALFEIANELKRNPTAEAVGLTVAEGTDGGAGQLVWVTPTDRVPDAVPPQLSIPALAQWATFAVPESRRAVLESILAYPIDDRPLLDRTRVGPVPKLPTTKLFLGADVRGIGGYDHVAFALLKGLPAAGVELRMHPVAAVRPDLVPPKLLPKTEPRKAGDPQLVMGPPFLVPRFGLDQASAVFTMWETDRFDPHWVDEINKSGLVIVPSRWQADCFRADGITTPIAVAPLGFDPLVFHPKGEFPAVCTFGTAGALTAGGMRKNAQWVVDVFRCAFPVEQNVRLRVKISPGSPGVETYDDPRIDVLRAVLPHAELADWYRSLTAYVNGSCGEGFGLHLIEAMACGRPLVTPCHTGLTAFFEPALGYAVDYKLVAVKNDIYVGNWAEPDAGSMASQLRAVYADRGRAERLGQLSAARAKRFTWKAAGRELVQALRTHGFLPN